MKIHLLTATFVFWAIDNELKATPEEAKAIIVDDSEATQLSASFKEYAFTKSGKKVKLFSDGTWTIETPETTPNSSLSYSDEQVRVSFSSARIFKSKYSESFSIFLEVKPNTETKFISFRTHRVWGYTDGSDRGGRKPYGFRVSDNFGNSFKIKNIHPSYIGHRSEKPLRPNETQGFSIKTVNVPLDATSSIELVINKNTLGNSNTIRFSIPMDKVEKPKSSDSKSD
ncbi:hypothetical protein [Rubritalea marina]|uniref:hypothetical protein n=1 Tax=Rubritalea marina TaxID=361055 RepID=UPI0012EA624F|nr:hypothetical protein [Rubritalea marina]